MTRAQARAETVSRVMAAASTVFGEQGYRSSTIRLIAHAAGVSVGDGVQRRVEGRPVPAQRGGTLDGQLAGDDPGGLRRSDGDRAGLVYVGRMVEASIAMPEAIQDYFKSCPRYEWEPASD